MDKKEKTVLLVAILASFVAFLDSAIINVALPAIQKNFGGGLSSSQWIVDSYLLTLGSFILVAGSVSDIFGRKKVLNFGLILFGVSSILCAISLNNGTLITSRTIQGLAAAFLVPSSLAILTNYVEQKNFTKAIGLWTAWTGIAFIIGPLVGGFLTDTFSWRWVFGINILPILLTLWLTKRLPVETISKTTKSIDFIGAATCALGLSGVVFALIEAPRLSWSNPYISGSLIIGLALLYIFFARERKAERPMIPLELFKIRNFSAANVSTLFIYAAISALPFILVIFLQQAANYSALRAGMSLLPVTIVIFLLSSKVGSLIGKYGPRMFMTIGPIISAIGVMLINLGASVDVNFWTGILPGITIVGLGMAILVTPLTSAVLSEVDKSKSGIASAINNAVARIAGLLAIAAFGGILLSSSVRVLENSNLPKDVLEPLMEQSMQSSQNPELSEILKNSSTAAFKSGLYTTAFLFTLGGITSALFIRNRKES